MFEVTARVSSQRQPCEPVTVLGAHGVERQRETAGATLTSVATLADVAREIWGERAPNRELLGRVARDAEASSVLGNDLLLTGDERPIGRVPSPLGRVDLADFGELQAEENILDELGGGSTAPGDTAVPSARLVVGEIGANGTADISMRVGDKVIGALVFAVDSLIVPVPAGTDALSVGYRPDQGFQQLEAGDAFERLTTVVGRPAGQLLLWRAYLGTNTFIVDGVADAGRRGLHRVKIGLVGGGVLVARVVFAAHRRLPGPRGDFTASRRRRRLELADVKTASACIDIREAAQPQPDLIVGVHGTMASGMHMAEALRTRTEWPLVRFEHDTWLPVEANARELAEQIERLDVKRGVLIGHSRGGLVARHAAEIVESQQPERVLRLVTLGTPFRGTPYVGAAGTSLLGARALLGAVSLASGAVAVDVSTRLAGLLMRGGLPRGIAAMDVGSDYLSGFAHRVPSAATTVAGEIDPTGPRDGSTIGLLRGVAPSAFQGQANDLLVAADSAAANPGDSPIVECDHFSYLKNKEALRAIDSAVVKTLQGPSAALERDLPVRAQPLGARKPASPPSEPEPGGRSVRW